MNAGAVRATAFTFQRRVKTSSNACIGLVFDFEFASLFGFSSHISKDKRPVPLMEVTTPPPACGRSPLAREPKTRPAAKEHKPCAELVFIFLPSSLRKVGRRRFSAGSEGALTLILSPPCLVSRPLVPTRYRADTTVEARKRRCSRQHLTLKFFLLHKK